MLSLRVNTAIQLLFDISKVQALQEATQGLCCYELLPSFCSAAVDSLHDLDQGMPVHASVTGVCLVVLPILPKGVHYTKTLVRFVGGVKWPEWQE